MSRILTLALLVLMATGLACQEQAAPTVDAPAVTADQAATQPAAEPLSIVSRSVAADGTIVARLSNHSTAIVKATRTNPVVCVRAYVRTGGLYEGQWLGTGISHLTEHLVAEEASHGTGANMTAAEVRTSTDRVSEIGAQANAYTSLDHTCYYISAAATKTNECIDLVADWMARAQISEGDFRREHGVVQRELEMGKDVAERQGWYAHMASLYAGHPAAVPVIGYAEPLARLGYQDVLNYHAKMYVPQNMVFSVVGDIDPEAVLRRLCKALAGFEPGRTPERILPEVPKVSSVRRVVRPHEAIKEVSQRVSFQTIPLLHEDLYALDVLSYVLTQGRASRLVEKIERKAKLITAITSSSWTPAWGTGAFTIYFRATLANADQAEQAILDELKLIIAEGVSDEELARAKRQKIADLVYAQQSVESIAGQLATDYLSARDVQFSKLYTDRIQQVTAEQVQAMAARYFDFANMVVTRMVPAGEQAIAAEVAAGAKSGPTLLSLPNGLRVVLRPDNSVGLVSMTMVSRGGILAETAETNGLGNFMAAMTVKGAGERSAEDIARFFDRAGGSIAGRCGDNTFYWQATVLQDSFEEALGVLADVIARPSFDADEMEILRPKLLAAVDRIDENWSAQLQKYFRRTFFTDSPYGMLTIGSRNVLEAATAEQLREHHRQHVLARSSVLAVVGNFDPEQAAKRIALLFGDLPEGEFKPRIGQRRSVAPEGELHVLETTNNVSGIMIAAPGMQLADLDDRLAIDVLDTIISGYHLPAGWLHNELRGKQLVYVVHAYNFVGLAPGAFVTYAACQPDQAAQVIQVIRRNLRDASEYEPTQAEIDQAVNTILTVELLDKQTMQELAMSAALDELYGLGHDFRSRLAELYGKITPADVQRVGRKYLSGSYVTSVTTPLPEALADVQAGKDDSN